MKLDVAIATAAGWDERRKAPLERLVRALPSKPLISVSMEREHARVWARRLWERLAALDDEPELHQDAWIVLNDDVTVHPEIRPLVEHLVGMLPDEIISLHGNFPTMRLAADAGARLLRCYWTSGPGYVLQRGHAREILNWLDTVPPDWFDGDVNEDGVLASWSWARQRPAYVTVPALVRHDTSVPSTVGYDDHPNRTSPLDWASYVAGWSAKDVESAPYVATPFFADHQFQALGLALRGYIPLCGLCRMNGGNAILSTRSGLCLGCARQVGKLVSK
jgi:hypothetical protein